MQRVLVFGALLAVAAALLQPDQTKAAGTDTAVYVELRSSDSAAAAERWKLYGSSYALVIGIDEYSGGWPRLSNAVRDAKEVAAGLSEQGFEVTTLLNPTGDKLRSELRNFFGLTGADPEARLFVWFAGHGYTELGEGYLVPADAPDPSDPLFRVTALHMGDVGSMVRIARSKHVFAVFDSCFAGTIFNASRARPPAAITRAVAEPVRQFLTSGDADQEVSDDGSFRKLFLKALAGEEDADANDDGYLTGTELSLFLEDRVVNLTNSAQTPRSGKLRDQRFDLGDFVFLLPKADEPVQVAAAMPEAPPAAETASRAGPDPELTVELAFWDAIKTSDSADDYQAYLTAYPNGRFAVLAEARLAKLDAAGAAQTRGAAPAEQPTQVAALPPAQVDAAPPDPAQLAEQAELALGLNRADRQELQAALTALGYDTKGIDGFFGPGTRDAIRRYQAAKGAEQSGYLTASLASNLIAEAPKPEPAPTPAAIAPAAEPAQTQVAAVPQPSAVLPPAAVVSKEEVERFFAAQVAEMTEKFLQYNYQARLLLLGWQSEVPHKIEVHRFNVLGIENDTVLAEVTLRVAGLNRYSGQTSATRDFLLRWTGSGLEVLRHLGDREPRPTSGAGLTNAAAIQSVAAQPSPPVQQPQQTEPQTAALPPAGVTQEEVESYVAGNQRVLAERFAEYNAARRLLLDHSSAVPPTVQITAFRLKAIAGDEVTATATLKETRSPNGRMQTVTRDFLLKWTGDGFEILGHQ